MPIFAVPSFDPPPWWGDLTESQRKTVLGRLRVKGYDVKAWPVTIR